VEDVTALLQTSMSVVAAPTHSNLVDMPLRRDIDEFRELIVSDLPYDDVTGRLQRRQYVIDRLKLDFSKDAARLAAEFGTEETEERLDAPTAGEWIRHNCKTSRSIAYDSINVGEQLSRLPQCADALVAGEIGFAHLSVIARTASALSKNDPASTFNEHDVLARARESSAGRLCGTTACACATRSIQPAWSGISALRLRNAASSSVSGRMVRF
jgi:hypothetical protein